MRNLITQPGRLFAPPCIAKELINVVQARARQYAFVADVLEPAHQIPEQIQLEFIAWRKVGVAAFGRKWLVAAVAIRYQPGFA